MIWIFSADGEFLARTGDECGRWWGRWFIRRSTKQSKHPRRRRFLCISPPRQMSKGNWIRREGCQLDLLHLSSLISFRRYLCWIYWHSLHIFSTTNMNMPHYKTFRLNKSFWNDDDQICSIWWDVRPWGEKSEKTKSDLCLSGQTQIGIEWQIRKLLKSKKTVISPFKWWVFHWVGNKWSESEPSDTIHSLSLYKNTLEEY